jgi:uncharacterized membrane protein YukC
MNETLSNEKRCKRILKLEDEIEDLSYKLSVLKEIKNSTK